MAYRLGKKIGISFLVVALAVILVSGGLLAACSRTQTTTTTMATTSATSTTTTVRPTATSTATTATTSATSTTTTVSAAAKFYKDNVVTIVIPYAPGGTTDYAARLIANFWTEVTGGRMVVVNKEGAGGLVGTNYVYAAKPDGLTMGEAIRGSLVSQTVNRDPALKYDVNKMNWIGFTNEGDPDGLVVGAKLPYTSMQDLTKVSGLKFGASARTSGSAQGTALIIELFGLKDARIVVGYGGGAELSLAVGKGELDGYSMGGATLVDGIKNGFTKSPFLTLDFARSPYFPDVPAVPELMKLSPAQESLLTAYNATRGGQVFWYQPDVPQDRIEFARNAFDKIVALEGFKKMSAAKWLYVPPVSGKDFAALMQKTMAAATPERFAELQALVDKYVR